MKNKKIKKTYFVGILILTFKKRNTFFTLLDFFNPSNLIHVISSGICRIIQNPENSIFVIQTLTKKIVIIAHEYNIRVLSLYFLKKTTLINKQECLDILYKFKLKILNIVDQIKIPHNGCRLKKMRSLKRLYTPKIEKIMRKKERKKKYVKSNLY